MYSMDDVEERMQLFVRSLIDFQTTLEETSAQTQRCHEVIDPLWHDETRRTYDMHFAPLSELMNRYVRVLGPEYISFLQQRLRALDGYLRG